MIRRGLWVALLLSACAGNPPGEVGVRAENGQAVAPPPHVHRIMGRPDMAPGVERPATLGPSAASGTNGITAHGGPVMATANVYFIWYGYWAADWNSETAPLILPDLADHIGASSYWNINTTYYDPSGNRVTNAVRYANSTTDFYSRGGDLYDWDVAGIVSDAITLGQLPDDPTGVYFVLTSSDVVEHSGFCTVYCGWHSWTTVAGSNIKYGFIGDASTQCPSGCMAQSNGPNNNPGADGMASVLAHELEESATDPDLNAWFDDNGEENADKCAWTFGPQYTAPNGTRANIHLGNRDYLIQQNWVNDSGGYCSMSYTPPPQCDPNDACCSDPICCGVDLCLCLGLPVCG